MRRGIPLRRHQFLQLGNQRDSQALRSIRRRSATISTVTGKADILWTNAAITGERYVWLMNGTTISSAPYLGGVAMNWQIDGTGDFNGDGKSDILWTNTSTGDRYVWLMNGTTLSSAVYLGGVPTNWQISGTGDFNADGQSDILWTNTSTGDRYVWLMNGTTLSSAVYLGGVPTNWQEIDGAGDFNADGKSDILWDKHQHGRPLRVADERHRAKLGSLPRRRADQLAD